MQAPTELLVASGVSDRADETALPCSVAWPMLIE
jgi:hypothetical protein